MGKRQLEIVKYWTTFTLCKKLVVVVLLFKNSFPHTSHYLHEIQKLNFIWLDELKCIISSTYIDQF